MTIPISNRPINKTYCILCKKLVFNNIHLPYCGKLCERKSKAPTRKCAVCNGTFHWIYEHHLYCSKKCSADHFKQKREKASTPYISRFKILSRDNFQCVYCGFKSIDGAQLAIDHVYPVSRGGKNNLFNLVTCCTTCNLEKSYNPLPDNQTLFFWEKAQERTSENPETYEGLVEIFNRIYKYKGNKFSATFSPNGVQDKGTMDYSAENKGNGK